MKRILLTGGSGKLGQAILRSHLFPGIAFAPSHHKLDIIKSKMVQQFFQHHNIHAVIHCAAISKMATCEHSPVEALKVNLIGTSNLVTSVLHYEKTHKRSIRFIHISTDAVYAGLSGNYKECDPTIPYNKYGWSKLGAECAVRLLTNYCIIRTNFFDPQKIPFDVSAKNMFTSKIPIELLVKAIRTLLSNSYIGTLNIGGERRSLFKLYKPFSPSLKACQYSQLKPEFPQLIAPDSSLNCSLWQKLTA